MKDTAKIAALDLPPATEQIEPFQVAVPQAALDDLHHRLAQTRWPDAQTVGDWSQGLPLPNAKALIEHWRDRYDWRLFEKS